MVVTQTNDVNSAADFLPADLVPDEDTLASWWTAFNIEGLRAGVDGVPVDAVRRAAEVIDRSLMAAAQRDGNSMASPDGNYALAARMSFLRHR